MQGRLYELRELPSNRGWHRLIQSFKRRRRILLAMTKDRLVHDLHKRKDRSNAFLEKGALWQKKSSMRSSESEEQLVERNHTDFSSTFEPQFQSTRGKSIPRQVEKSSLSKTMTAEEEEVLDLASVLSPPPKLQVQITADSVCTHRACHWRSEHCTAARMNHAFEDWIIVVR